MGNSFNGVAYFQRVVKNSARTKKGVQNMSEHLTQAAFFSWLAYKKLDGVELAHAIPNGGLRPGKAGAMLKAEGVKAGVPDVYIPIARGGYIGLAIEFKHGDNNPSAAQKERIDKMQKEGWCVVICWSWEAAAKIVQGYTGMLKVCYD
jgi:hypothetical protein